jgi:hypothetical protein
LIKLIVGSVNFVTGAVINWEQNLISRWFKPKDAMVAPNSTTSISV